MIDLRETMLPNAIEVDGKPYFVDTDFRTWIKFGEDYEDGVVPFYIFTKDVPEGNYEPSALQFYANPNATPRNTHTSPYRLIDYVLDGEYIVASFQQAYGIDLTDPKLKMHWHRFKALLEGLPDDTKMSKIIGYRSWSNSKKSHETIMREQREMWRLPEKGEAENIAEAKSIAEILWERQNGGE